MRAILVYPLLFGVGVAGAQPDSTPPAPNQSTTAGAESTYRVELKIVEQRAGSKAPSGVSVQKRVSWDDVLTGEGDKVLMAPTITVRANQTATVAAHPSKPIKYLVPDGEKRFAIKELAPRKLGLEFAVKIEDAAVTVGVDSASLHGGSLGTDTFVGVDVPIGKPIVKQDSIESVVSLDELPARIAIPTADGKHAYLLIRVTKQ